MNGIKVILDHLTKTDTLHTSGFPVESKRTKDDFPTLGAPTRQSVGISRSTTGIALKVCKSEYYILH